MNSLPIVALIGMIVLVTATVGFGAILVDAPTFNLIGASENNAIATARGNVTNIDWVEEVGPWGHIETDRIDYVISNNSSDATSITFDVCAVIEFNNSTWGGGQYFSPPVGDPPACKSSSALAAQATEANYIEFNLAVNVTEIVDLSISIQEAVPVTP